MDIQSTAIFVGVIVAFAVTIWRLLGKIRSPILGVIAACLGIIAAVCAWNAWAETKSTSWTMIVDIIVFAAVVAAIRQFSRMRSTVERRCVPDTPQQ
jgi:hypothetical protein